jgi:voltage-gated sodium channel
MHHHEHGGEGRAPHTTMHSDATYMTTPWRQRLARWVESKPIQQGITWLILINAVVLGLETSDRIMADWGPWLIAVDHLILAVFVIEIALRILAHRLAFFRDPWSLFDFTVVAIALVPASEAWAVLRSLRVLRVMRLLSTVPSMRRVVAGLLAAIPGLSSVFAVICIIFYVGAVVATNLFGERFPEWFGSLGESAYTLFQVMTLESWSMGIARPVMDAYPWAWGFFVIFILVSTFTLLNLFIAVIVNAIQSEQEAEQVQSTARVVHHIDDETRTLQSELRELRTELRALRESLAQDRPGQRPR